VFDAAEYDRLVTAVGNLITELRKDQPGAAGTPPPPDGNWLLQPDGQAWRTAIDLVNAGKTFGNHLSAHAVTLLSRLEGLFDGFCSARTVFCRVNDLAAYSAESFGSEYPALRPSDQCMGGPQ